MTRQETLTILGKLSAEEFLTEYWQKKPLLIRQAIPNFEGFLNPNDLAGLACEAEVQSRIVIQQKETWLLEHGPFEEARFTSLPESNWTLLVQSVDHHLPEAKDLLKQFNFIPYARLDDLMVSYAPIGGSVGPHFDSYDVFLLQANGKRQWQISGQSDQTLVPDFELRILENFMAETSWELAPGDMLYLPPQYAHWGIASSDDCMTYSIGFRAPDYQSLGQAFLGYLQDQMAQSLIKLNGRYEDPDLKSTNSPAKIQMSMINEVSDHLSAIPMEKSSIANFLGQHLTEPKAEVFFEQLTPLSFEAFQQQILRHGLMLDLQSQCLYDDRAIYMNGEFIAMDENLEEILTQLADDLGLTPEIIKRFSGKNSTTAIKVLHDWYQAGYCHLGNAYD